MRAKRARGFSLIECMVALALLGLAGASAAEQVGQVRLSVEMSARREAEIRKADQVLVGLSRHSRSALMRLAGRRTVNGHVVGISQLSPTLLRIVVWDERGESPLVATTVFRAESSGQSP